MFHHSCPNLWWWLPVLHAWLSTQPAPSLCRCVFGIWEWKWRKCLFSVWMTAGVISKSAGSCRGRKSLLGHEENLNCILLASSKPLGWESQRSLPADHLLQWVLSRRQVERMRAVCYWDSPVLTPSWSSSHICLVRDDRGRVSAVCPKLGVEDPMLGCLIWKWVVKNWNKINKIMLGT